MVSPSPHVCVCKSVFDGESAAASVAHHPCHLRFYGFSEKKKKEKTLIHTEKKSTVGRA